MMLPRTPVTRFREQGAMTGTTSDDNRADTDTRGTPGDGPVAVRLPLDVVLPCSAEAPGLARQALRRWIAALDCPEELVEEAALIVSETVTNAVVHAGSATRLFVTVIEGRLRVEVGD